MSAAKGRCSIKGGFEGRAVEQAASVKAAQPSSTQRSNFLRIALKITMRLLWARALSPDAAEQCGAPTEQRLNKLVASSVLTCGSCSCRSFPVECTLGPGRQCSPRVVPVGLARGT